MHADIAAAQWTRALSQPNYSILISRGSSASVWTNQHICDLDRLPRGTRGDEYPIPRPESKNTTTFLDYYPGRSPRMDGVTVVPSALAGRKLS